VYLHCSGSLCSDAVESALPCSSDASGDPWDLLPNGDSPGYSFQRPLKGADLLVTRCPCLHPGDVRVLRAVPLDELVVRAGALHSDRERAPHAYFSALPNVLVFPQKGSRPHPSECSGGDLARWRPLTGLLG